MTIDFDSSTVLIFAVLYFGIVAFLRLKQKRVWVYLFFFTLFFIYLIEVLRYTQFPIYLSKYMREAIGQNVWKNMNLIPLITLEYTSFKTSLLNIALFIPFGFGLPFISRHRMGKIVAIGILFSVILETLQLVIALGVGFTFRVVDINDVIFNTVGVIIGYILFVIFVHMFRFTLDKWSIKQSAILQYIYKRL